jgi:hypothetical protein
MAEDDDQPHPYVGQAVSNEVLLEKINQLHATSKDNKERIDKLAISVNQNFQSIAEVLRQGYVSKDELVIYKEMVGREVVQLQKDIMELRVEVSKRLHKDAFKPYAWALNSIATSGLLAIVALFGKMLKDYIAGGPPQ